MCCRREKEGGSGERESEGEERGADQPGMVDHGRQSPHSEKRGLREERGK